MFLEYTDSESVPADLKLLQQCLIRRLSAPNQLPKKPDHPGSPASDAPCSLQLRKAFWAVKSKLVCFAEIFGDVTLDYTLLPQRLIARRSRNNQQSTMLNVPSAASQEAIGELASHPAFHHAILHSIPQITKSLEDERRGVRSGAAGAIGRLSDHVVFHEAIQGSVSRVVALLNDGDGLVRSAAGVTIGRLARHAVFHKAIQDCFPNVLGLLKDEDELARSAGTETIGSLAAQPVFYDMIRDSVPQVLDLVKDKSGSVRSASAGAIGKLAEHRVFHNAILGSVSQVVALLSNRPEAATEARLPKQRGTPNVTVLVPQPCCSRNSSWVQGSESLAETRLPERSPSRLFTVRTRAGEERLPGKDSLRITNEK
ncbi:armadillo-type protein [Mycena olivaceomarginata]|nr:armadillo-type protein [Mycena olivaceomarginata]